MTESEKSLFIKAIEQGYIYFRDYQWAIHKGLVVGYEDEIIYKTRLVVAYGVLYYLQHEHLRYAWQNVYVYDDEELIKNPKKHKLITEKNYRSEIILRKNKLDCQHYGSVWALTKEELL